MKKFCFAVFSLMLAFSIASCGDDGDDVVTPGSGSGTTGGTVPDPVGTITLSMRNASNGDTRLDSYIHIDKDDNFEGWDYWYDSPYGSPQYVHFASVGQVKGLGNVTGIPANGWARKIAVVPGEGVVAYANGKFYRIYVQDYLYAAGTGGVIGAEIKYQKPFGGVDEAIKFDRKSIAINSKGGAEDVLCANATIIPFTVSCSEGWCRVITCSTHEYSWLVDGVHIECDENFSESSRTATITVTTQTKKQTTFTVTQTGGGPIIKVLNGQADFSAFGGEQNIEIVTNQAFNNLQISDVPSWLNAELVDNSAAVRAEQKKVRWIGNNEVGETRASSESTVKSYVLHLSTEGNPFTTQRDAEIKIATKDGKLSERMMVTQGNGWFRDYYDAKTIDVNKDQGKYTASFYTSIKPESLVVKISDSWVKAELKQQSFNERNDYGYYVYMPVTYEANPALKDRSATINIYASDGKTLIYTYTVNQKAQTFDVKEKVYLDKKGGAQTITISTSMTSWDATSSASWLTFSKNGNQITIRAEEYTGSNADRTATITFKDLGRKITVIQSKYAVGDTYSEGKITGKVVTMNDSIRLICSDNLGEAAWSTENVLTGANSYNDGVYNTNIIKSIPGYKTLYPAFALVEELNVNGATGWYLPAKNECTNIGGAWSSTEDSGTTVYTTYSWDYKSGKHSVYAFRRF
ncbi:MAG: DUF5036 family protein [Bacteroidales bacterium]|nr:DUF5036 family protein [Bacteroidales bacterium]